MFFLFFFFNQTPLITVTVNYDIMGVKGREGVKRN